MDLLTEDQIKAACPKSIKGNITKDLTKNINSILMDPDIRNEFRDNILSYTDVLTDGRWKFSDYINAIKFTSYKLRGDSNLMAFSKTFPDRIARYQSRNVTDFSPWVTSYTKSKLVIEILKRSLIPTYILNADIHQKAINVLATLMVTATSEKVRAESANSLLINLKQPESSKIELDLNIKQDDAIGDLRTATAALVEAQRQQIALGTKTAEQIAHSVIATVEGEVIEE